MKKTVAIIFGLAYTTKLIGWDSRNNLWAPAYPIWRGAEGYTENRMPKTADPEEKDLQNELALYKSIPQVCGRGIAEE